MSTVPGIRLLATVLFVGLTIASTGCASPETPTMSTPTTESLAGSSWRLAAFRDSASAVVVPLSPDAPYTIAFAVDGRFSGVADCNRHFGSYDADGAGGFSTDGVGSTRAMCPQQSISNAFLDAIGTADGVSLSNGHLRIVSPDKTLTFVPDADAGSTQPGDSVSGTSAPLQNTGSVPASFRAVGNEPGWLLEITAGAELVLKYDYGQSEVRAATPEPVTNPHSGARTYRAAPDGHQLVVEITQDPCSDTMSGEAFPATVTVKLDDRTLQGCGRPQ